MRNTYRTTKSGEKVIYGLAANIHLGNVMVGPDNPTDGRLESVTIKRISREFVVDGQTMVYGYLTSTPPKATPAHRRSYRSCVTYGNCSSFGDGSSCGGHDCDGY